MKLAKISRSVLAIVVVVSLAFIYAGCGSGGGSNRTAATTGTGTTSNTGTGSGSGTGNITNPGTDQTTPWSASNGSGGTSGSFSVNGGADKGICPSACASGGPHMLVIWLHGSGGSSSQGISRFTGGLADQAGVIALCVGARDGGMYNHSPGGASEQAILAAIDECRSKYNIGPTVTAGFSMGAAYVYGICIRNPQAKLNGGAAYDGEFANAQLLESYASQDRVPVFCTSASYPSGAQDAYDWLTARGYLAEHRAYGGSHSVSSSQIAEGINWLKGIIGP
ncbi:MAG: alpha/beta hydrolase [Planctomycetota bacterium]